MNVYNSFLNAYEGDEIRVLATTYLILSRDEFRNSIELVVKDYEGNDTYSLFLSKSDMTVTHEDGYTL